MTQRHTATFTLEYDRGCEIPAGLLDWHCSIEMRTEGADLLYMHPDPKKGVSIRLEPGQPITVEVKGDHVIYFDSLADAYEKASTWEPQPIDDPNIDPAYF